MLLSAPAAYELRDETPRTHSKQATQINTRINPSLKEQGEAGFAAAGLTSSEAIRMLYEFAAEHVLQPESIRKALAPRDNTSPDVLAQRQAKRAALEQGPRIVSAFLESTGAEHISSEMANLPYKRLEELAYAEKYGVGV